MHSAFTISLICYDFFAITACLKITSLVCCKHILWVGTTAGVLVTLRLPKMLASHSSQQMLDINSLSVTGKCVYYKLPYARNKNISKNCLV